MLPHETLYVGVDVGKRSHVAGFLSTTLLARHQRFEACPALTFENSRDGFRALLERIKGYVPLTQIYCLLEVTGHYHKALLQYLQELDIPKSVLPNPRPCSYLALHVVDMFTKNTVVVSFRWPL
jgi:transposase